MLFVIDVGNTNTVLGVFSVPDDPTPASEYKLLAHWRVGSVRTQTVDEYGVPFRNLFATIKIETANIRDILPSSVVPCMASASAEICERYSCHTTLFIEPSVKTGMQVQY